MPLADIAQWIYVDHRGTGRSGSVDLETCTFDRFADDIDELRRLLGLERIGLLGHSFGGWWALAYALRYPSRVSRLVLVSTSATFSSFEDAGVELASRGTPEQLATAPLAFQGQVVTADDARKWWRVMVPLYFHHWDEEITGAMIARMRMNPNITAHMFKSVMPAFDVWERLHRIRVPTLVMVGRHDWVTSVNQSKLLAAGIPHSASIVLEESGHFPFIEEQSRFIEHVARFIDGRFPAEEDDRIDSSEDPG